MKQSIAILALLGNISAVNLQREPLLSKDATPLLVHQKPEYSDYAVDYKVPNFGMSHEMRYTQDSIKAAEDAYKHPLMADFGKAAPEVATPRGYTVPDFGVDTDIKDTHSNLSQAETYIGNLIIQGQKEAAARAAAAARVAKAKQEAEERLAKAREAAQAKLNAVKAQKLDEQTEATIIEENVHIIETVEEANKEIIGAAQAEGEAEIASAH